MQIPGTKGILFFFAAILTINICVGQDVLENNPAALRWSQINTPNFKVIFPQGFDAQAQRMASTLEHIRSAESRTMGKEPRRISIILQNQSSVSNGFVSQFPRRSEFFAMPSQNYNFTGTNEWLDLLAAHEYRHIVQYQQAFRGFNKVLFYLFGSPTFSAMAHLAAPDWLWEGDAVATETAFTPSGRGKIPHFAVVFRTNLLEGRTFNYHKQYLRSYKHHIPDHYVLGFHMVSYLRKRTNDPDIWEKITQRSWSVPFLPFAFSNAIRNKTGLSVTRLYREMAKDLRADWQADIDKLTLTPFEIISKRESNAYTDYLYPQPLPDGSVLAMKQGIGDIQQFVLLRDGEEDKVFTPGIMNDAGYLTSANNVVVWNELGFNPRWQVQTFSLIKAYDWKNDVKMVVSDKRARFASAALSPDGKRLATVRTDESYQHTLLVLDFPSGNTLKEYANPENNFYSMPRWTSDGSGIVVLKLTREGKSVDVINATTGKTTSLLPVSQENIGHPVITGDLLFFNSPGTGIDNIFALHIPSGKRYQVTQAKYGAYNPAISDDGKYLYYNEQTRNGMDVVRIPLDVAAWQVHSPVRDNSNLYDHLVEQEGQPGLFDSIPKGDYHVSKYSKLGHVINPFSWGLFVQNDLSSVDIGVTSQDVLSTLRLSAGYTLDLNENTGYWRAGVSYQGLYPVIDLMYTEGDRSVDEELTTTIRNNGETTRITDTYTVEWKERNFLAGLRLPLTLTRSKFYSGIEVGYQVGLTQIEDFNNDAGNQNTRFIPSEIVDGNVTNAYFLIDYLNQGSMIFNHASLSAHRLMKTSRRDIISKWGQTISMDYYGTPFGGDFDGGLFSATAALYFPGLIKHHAIYSVVAYQKTMLPINLEADNYLFRNNVPLPRGINDYVARFRDYVSVSLNYALPIWYPDIAIGPLLNIQRVRLTAFGDYAQGSGSIFSNADADYASIGGEVKFDINILRFLPQLDIGFRYSYGLEPSVDSFELVIGTFNF
jgi:hypothetical protein